MADTYYAWSPIRHGTDDGKVKTIKVGDEVSAADLGVDDEEFQDYIDSGAVRTRKYPKIGTSTSPAEHYKEQLANAAAADYVNLDAEEDPAEQAQEKKYGFEKS